MSSRNGKNWFGFWTFIIGLVVVVTFLQSGFFLQSRVYQYLSEAGSQFASIISGVLASNTNEYRVSNNEALLVVSEKLNRAAQMKADDMAKRGYFSHVGPTGEKPWYWFEKVGYKYEYAGENLAINFTESNDVSQAWINSAKHNANLLNRNFSEIGIGIADGFYQGKLTTFVVQFFGKPFVESDVEYTEKVIPTTKTIVLDKSSSSTIPVVTRDDLPSGVVLGTEDEVFNKGVNLRWVFVGILLISIISYGIYFSIKK